MKNPHAYTAYKPSGVPWLDAVPERRRRLMRLQGFDYTRQGGILHHNLYPEQGMSSRRRGGRKNAPQ